jgi:hypothetical protein
MIYYRVALRANHSPAWKWQSTILTSLEALFRWLRMYGGLSNDCIRLFFASSKQGLDKMSIRANQGAVSNSMTVLLQPGNPYWRVLLVFRDYLRHHPDTAHQYSLLKKQLAEQCATDPLAYLHGKADFIRAVLQVAAGGDRLTTIQKFLPEHGHQYQIK